MTKEHCDANPQGEQTPFSAALIETLTAHKTAAIAAELTQNSRVALAAVVHALVTQEFRLELDLYGVNSCLQISTTKPDLREVENSSAAVYLAEQRQNWLSILPKKPTDFWSWCCEQEDSRLLQLLAFCVANTVNAIQSKNDPAGQSRAPYADALATALTLDMTRWFQPQADNFFQRISKTQILDALKRAGKSADHTRETMKKAQLAKAAEQELAGTGWLPEPLRINFNLAAEMNRRFHDDSEIAATHEEQEADQ
jgi:ParB family transcriptional regulator, chromosome partitioning protein